jgi:Ca2+-binding EF-hand superfamily protein
MGSKNTKPGNHYNWNDLSLTQVEIYQLEDIFKRTAGKDGKISQAEFRRLFEQMNPHLPADVQKALSDRAFIAADTNRDGTISRDEFIAYYILTRPQPQSYNCNSIMSPAYNSQNALTFTTQQSMQHNQQIQPSTTSINYSYRSMN